MSNIIWAVSYFFIQILNGSNARIIDSTVSQIIKHHFREMNGVNLYFCHAKDSKSAFQTLFQQELLYMIRSLDKVESNYEINVNFQQPQVIGVFLDITCKQGVTFLKQSSNMFNSSYKWLLWSDNFESTKDLLTPMRVLADSDVTVAFQDQSEIITLFDIYRIHVTLPFRQTVIAQWSNGELTQENKLPNRENFEGISMAASVMVPEAKFNISNFIGQLLERSFEHGIDGMSRYGLAVFLHLAEMSNFSYSFKLSKDWGVELKRGAWSGYIGQLQRREAEIGLTPLKFKVKPSRVLDYITSIDKVRPCFTFLQPKMFGNNEALIRPLDNTVWACLLVITIMSILMFRIVAFYEGNTEHNDSWGGSFLIVVAALSQQGLPDSAEKLSTRLIYLSLLIVSFFAVAYYNTAILNGLLLKAPKRIQNIEQLLQYNIELGVVDRQLLKDELKNNDTITEEVRRKIWQNEESNKRYFTIEDGVMRIKQGQFALFTRDEDVYAELLNRLSDAEICSVSEVEMFNPYHAGAVAINNSPYKEIFSRKFDLMRERGVMDRQRNYWREPKPECHWRQDPLVISAGPLLMAFLVMIVGAVLSLLMLITEVIVYHCMFNKSVVNVKPFDKTQ